VRGVSANLDPRREDHSTARLLAEYVLSYVTAIRRAPLTGADRLRCYRYLLEWLASRTILEPLKRTEMNYVSTLMFSRNGDRHVADSITHGKDFEGDGKP
jgi:hypothetical protein